MSEQREAIDEPGDRWDLRAHRSLPWQTEREGERHEVGSGFDVVSRADLEADAEGLEELCREEVNKCFGDAGELLVNPHPVSGSIANLAVLSALLDPGDRIVAFASGSVGHFSLGGLGSLSARLYNVSSPEPDRREPVFDFPGLWRDQQQASLIQPRLVAFGPSAYPRRIDWALLRALADSFSPRALVLADVSHIAGPIAAGLLESPFPYADVVTLTTYKSLCGPPGAIILGKSRELHERVARALIPGLQDRAYLTSLGQLVAALSRAHTPEFRRVQYRAASLAEVLAASLAEGGLDLAFGGTDTHIVVIDLERQGLSAPEAVAVLAARRILVDPVRLPGDSDTSPRGLRLGTVALAQAGCEAAQLRGLGDAIASLLKIAGQGHDDQLSAEGKRRQAAKQNTLSGARATAGTEGQPDKFMFRQFRRHSRVLRTAARYDYFMLSGGANLFPVSAVWKELLTLEVVSDLAYGWYTSQEGFPSLQRAVSMWENHVASQGKFPSEKPLGSHVCMTLGASQAVAAVFDYWAVAGASRRSIFLGLNYGLFERLARHHDLALRELLADDPDGRTLPSVEDVVSILRSDGPALVVLVTPNNPSGEQYGPEDISQILRTAVATGSLVLLDQVGQMPIAQDNWLNIGELIARERAMDNAVVVNSFSKSDGVPGFRLGYLLGPERVIQHAAQYQLLSTMNPPTVPLLPPFFSFLSRCVHTSERFGWTASTGRGPLLSFARHMMEVTTAVAPPVVLEEMNRRLSREGFELDHARYVSHQEHVGRAVIRNHAYVLSRLGKYLSRVTPLQGGFNFLVELEPFAGLDEDDVCRRLFNETAVAILTESCFRISRRNRRNFWVRMSLAAPTDRFERALDRLVGFLETM